MSYDTISINTDAYTAAAQRATSAASALQNATNQLLAAAQASGSSAGHGAGDKFADWYDPQAATVLETSGALISALYGLAARFTDTAAAHTRTESASAGNPADPPDAAPVPLVAVPKITSVRGGTGSIPAGWQMVERWVGDVWPDSDLGRLANLHTAWADYEQALSAARSQYLADIMSAFDGYQSPELPAAQQLVTELSDELHNLASTAGSIGADVGDFVGQVTTAHHTIVQFLLELAATIAVGGVISAILTPITMGASDLIDAGIDAAELAVTGARIGNVLRELTLVVLRFGRSAVRVAWTLDRYAKDGTAGAKILSRFGMTMVKGGAAGGMVWGPASMAVQYATTGHVDVVTTEASAIAGGSVGGAVEGAISAAGESVAEAVPAVSARSQTLSSSKSVVENSSPVEKQIAAASGRSRHAAARKLPGNIEAVGEWLGKGAGIASGNYVALKVSDEFSGSNFVMDSMGDVPKEKLVVIWPKSPALMGAHAAW